MFCCGTRRTKALNLLSLYDCSVLHTFIRPPLVSSDRLRLQEAWCKRAYAAQQQNTLCTGGEKSSTVSEGSWAAHPQFCPAGLCTGPSASFSHGAPFFTHPTTSKAIPAGGQRHLLSLLSSGMSTRLLFLSFMSLSS